MTYTQNYQLPQWVKSDRILMDDFNDANAKIDAALKSHDDSLAGHAAQLENFGNCRVVTGTYAGQGRWGDHGSTSLTFPHRPLLVIIHPNTYAQGHSLTRLLLLQGSTFAFSYMDLPPSQCDVVWSGNSVSWHNASSDTYQCDRSGTTYRYVALLDMEN